MEISAVSMLWSRLSLSGLLVIFLLRHDRDHPAHGAHSHRPGLPAQGCLLIVGLGLVPEVKPPVRIVNGSPRSTIREFREKAWNRSGYRSASGSGWSSFVTWVKNAKKWNVWWIADTWPGHSWWLVRGRADILLLFVSPHLSSLAAEQIQQIRKLSISPQSSPGTAAL